MHMKYMFKLFTSSLCHATKFQWEICADPWFLKEHCTSMHQISTYYGLGLGLHLNCKLLPRCQRPAPSASASQSANQACFVMWQWSYQYDNWYVFNRRLASHCAPSCHRFNILFWNPSWRIGGWGNWGNNIKSSVVSCQWHFRILKLWTITITIHNCNCNRNLAIPYFVGFW